MLPLPILDNEKYEDILLEAKRQIPALTKEWTDFNYHDPGITMLQMLAWLKEMQQYYLDSIGDVHRLKYLKLLNYLPKNAKAATVQFQIGNVSTNLYIPKGTKIDAQGVIFQTDKRVHLLANAIKSVQSCINEKYQDISHVLDTNSSLAEFLFGKKPIANNCFILGYNKALPANEINKFYIELAHNGIKRNAVTDTAMIPLAELKWEYWNGTSWEEINVLKDETISLIQSGYIEFCIPSQMAASSEGLYNEELYWIKCTLIKSNYDVSPRLESININSVQAEQKNTLSEVLEFDSNGESTQSFLLDTYLCATGTIIVQVKDNRNLWKDIDNFQISDADDMGLLLVIFSDEAIPKGVGNVRVIAISDEYKNQNILGSCNGFSGEKFNVNVTDIVYDDFLLQVGFEDRGQLLWEDWHKTEDIFLVDHGSKAYVLNANTGEIVFGDGENGLLPYQGVNNIRVIGLSVSKGAQGNIKDGEASFIFNNDTETQTRISELYVKNYKCAEGGTNAETIEAAVLRFRKDFTKVSRAITEEDFIHIVKSTPGLIIDKVNAIPGYVLKNGSLVKSTEGNCITLVVKPYSDQTGEPTLNGAYIENIRAQINRYRLVSTEVNITSPKYIGINVYCKLVTKTYYKDVKAMLGQFISNELDAVYGKRNLGQSVEYGDIYGKLKSLDCVNNILSLSLESTTTGAIKNSDGDIIIPPDGLTYLNNYEFDIKE